MDTLTVSPRARLLTTPQVAELLGVSADTVHALVSRRTLTAVRLTPRGRLRFRVDDVERLIAGEVAAPSESGEWET